MTQIRREAVLQLFHGQRAACGDMADFLSGALLQGFELEFPGDAVQLHQGDIGADGGENIQPDGSAFMLGFSRPGADQRGERAGGIVVTEDAERGKGPALFRRRAGGLPGAEQIPGEGGE